ncbi:hypothetical protein BJY04DRAFT_184731 [Aspergillus karnatakaensis]|uniref:uncharacterized protein n=1 Tax=Aspergillus karnatakaensis TaxID=1810916 RepID=UPI003CCE00BE
MDDGITHLGSYPVLEGVAPDSSSSATFEHLETVEETQETSQATSDPYDTFASSYSLSTVRPLAVPDPRPPPRHIQCYHGTVTRQWRVADYETCDNCGRRPFLRWFYLCTEDTTGYMSLGNRNGSFLSSWMTDAILAGEYTDEQERILVEQRLGVLEMCEMERDLAQASLSYHKARLNSNEAGHAASISRAQHLEYYSEAGPSNVISQMPTRPPRCHYRACHRCDRGLIEKAWLHLDEICSVPNVKPPSTWDLRERPVSEVKHVKNLGLRPPAPPKPPPHSSQYVYHAARVRAMRHLAGFNSSMNLAGMSDLTIVEENIEMTEFFASMDEM